jgi:N-succinyldiaminopimelate aminotransferase
MNPLLDLLQPYPFQKLAALFKGVEANPAYKPVSLHIGEPKHTTPQFICDALSANLNGLANYPTTIGSDALRGGSTAAINWPVRVSNPKHRLCR